MNQLNILEQSPIGALSPASFCIQYGIKRAKLYQLIAEGQIAIKKVGTRTIITVAEAERWLASLPSPAHKRIAA